MNSSVMVKTKVRTFNTENDRYYSVILRQPMNQDDSQHKILLFFLCVKAVFSTWFKVSSVVY